MPETAGRGRLLSRRSVVVLGLGTLAASCTADPRIGTGSPSQGSPSEAPRPTTAASATPAPEPPPTFAGGPEAAASELALAGRIVGVRGRWKSQLSDGSATFLDQLAAAHRTHAAALTSTEPTARPSSGTATPVPHTPKAGNLGDALDDLSSREGRLTADHRRRALQATGFSALLWGSMAVAAAGFADAVATADTRAVASFAKTPQRHDLPILTDTAAIQDLVAQLHAAVYGYQLAIGQLDTSADKDRALARLREIRQLRDALIGSLTARKAKVPVPSPAYEPSVLPTSPARAARLIRAMERALLPFVGLWLSSAPQNADRAQAYAALLATDAAARSWEAGLIVWPGWNG